LSRSIFVCTTIRHFFLSILFSNKTSSKDKKLILLAIDHQSVDASLLKNCHVLFSNIEFIFLNESDILNSFKKGSLFSRSEFISRNIYMGKKGILFPSSKIIEYFQGRGVNFQKDDEIFIYHDRTFLAKFFLNMENVNLIEDGLVNYYPQKVGHPLKSVVRLLKGLAPFYFFLGEADSISNVYYNDLNLCPDITKHKAKDLSFIYDVDESLIILMRELYCYEPKGYKYIFLTQGLDIAGLCSTGDKHYIYQHIIEALMAKCEVLALKIHPSEACSEYDYLKDMYPSLDIIIDKIPFEFISLFEKECTVLSLSSSSKIIDQGKLIAIENLITSNEVWNKFNVEEILGIAMEKVVNLNGCE